MDERRRTTLFLAAITLLGFGLRLTLLNSHPFREDEAIYSFWARHAWPGDPLFLTVWPDKPPLFIWLLAIAFRIFGPVEASARWLNIAASTLTIPVVAVTARTLWSRAAWREQVALLAGLAMALNPFAISFAPTAFTDPMLVFFGSLALLMALRTRLFWAGLWLGAAIMTKQQGLLHLPLIAGAGWIAASKETDFFVKTRFLALHFLAGAALVILPILYWDSLRWAVAPSPWDLGVQHYGGLSLAPPGEWFARVQAWAALVWQLGGSWLVWGGLAGLWAFHGWRRRTRSFAGGPGANSRGAAAWGWTLLWAGGFLIVHIVTTVQVWDRYLLPLAPVMALFSGWTLAATLADVAPRPRTIAVSLAAFLLLFPAWSAAQGRTPMGGDHGAYDGLRQAIAWARAAAPEEAILYHRELGWDYQFYLFDEVRTGRYALRWFPNATALADDVTKHPYPRAFYIQPDWAPLSDNARQLPVRGIERVEVARFGRMTVYELRNRDTGFCDWCFCRETARELGTAGGRFAAFP